MVGVLDGTDEFAIKSAIRIVRDGGAEQLERMLPLMPDKQAANLIATGSMVQLTAYVERVMDPNLSLPACRRADNGAMWMVENLLEFPGTAEVSSFFEEGCMAERLTLLPYQWAQVSMSTAAGGLEMSSAESRTISASIGAWWQRCRQSWLTSPAVWGRKHGGIYRNQNSYRVCGRE